MKLIEWIDVGMIAAERDENLRHYFYDAGISKKMIKNPNMFLMLGRKGAGKTAIFKHLSDRPSSFFSSKDVVMSLSLTNYSWNAHGLLKDEEKGGSYTYRESWRFVIMVEAIRGLFKLHSEKRIKGNAKLREAN